MNAPEDLVCRLRRIAVGEYDSADPFPALDEQLLRSYVGRALPADVESAVSLLIVSSRAWRERYAELVTKLVPNPAVRSGQ